MAIKGPLYFRLLPDMRGDALPAPHRDRRLASGFPAGGQFGRISLDGGIVRPCRQQHEFIDLVWKASRFRQRGVDIRFRQWLAVTLGPPLEAQRDHPAVRRGRPRIHAILALAGAAPAAETRFVDFGCQRSGEALEILPVRWAGG